MSMIDTDAFKPKLAYVEQLRQVWRNALAVLPENHVPDAADETQRLRQRLAEEAEQAYYGACVDLYLFVRFQVEEADAALGDFTGITRDGG